MIPKNTAIILRLMLRSADKTGHNINQIAKSSKISIGSAFKILKDLEKNKIVFARSIGNALYYKVNLEDEEAIKICELLLIEEKRKLSGYAKLYADELRAFDKAELVVLFGSVLKKKEFNDIDALFVFSTTNPNTITDVNDFCLNLSKIRSKPVVPLILKKTDLINGLQSGKESITEIMRTGVVLKGESIFLEVVKNAAK